MELLGGPLPLEKCVFPPVLPPSDIGEFRHGTDTSGICSLETWGDSNR